MRWRCPPWLAIGFAMCTTSCLGTGAHSPSNEHLPPGPVPCVIIEREGDPATALAATVMTAGIEDDARPAVALAALMEARLAPKWRGASFVPNSDGFRINGLVGESDASAIATRLRAVMLAPVSAIELPPIKKKLDALAHRPLPIPASSSVDAKGAVVEVARCDGTPFSSTATTDVSIDRVEGWRRAAIGEGRLAFGVVGNAHIASIASTALTTGARWPRAAPLAPSPPQSSEGAAAIIEAAPGIPPATARVTVAFRNARAAPVIAAAGELANPESALASRLSALGGARPLAQLRDVTATAHPFGGCLSLTLDVNGARFLEDANASAGRVAEVIALARQEVTLLLSSSADTSLGMREARRAGDPREGAALASWWALVRDDVPSSDRVAVVVRTPPSRDFQGAKHDDATSSSTSDLALRSALEAAKSALKSPIVETRVRVERGQEELWVLIASPCGTLAERASDAGLSATFLVAAASEGASRAGSEVALEPWISPDGVGLVAHGAARAGETPTAHARRIADVAARYFAAEPLAPATLSLARGSLLARAETIDARELGELAVALYPDHPSWLDGQGNADALARSSDGSLLARADDLRRGPLRVAVLANATAEQGRSAVEAADRWIARRSSGVRACGSPPSPPQSRAGTYAIEISGRPPQAELALRLPHDDLAARTLASWWASLLDGDDGLLASALGTSGLARSWSARVLGPDHDGAFVVRVVSSEGALDAAVAQTRALFDRIRSGAITAQDLTRAAARRSQKELISSLDPRARLVATWRGTVAASTPPTLDALRGFAASFFRDDALVIVAARPPHLEDTSREKSP